MNGQRVGVLAGSQPQSQYRISLRTLCSSTLIHLNGVETIAMLLQCSLLRLASLCGRLLTVANSVQYECAYLVTEDYPTGDKETIFKAGDRIVQVSSSPPVCNTSLTVAMAVHILYPLATFIAYTSNLNMSSQTNPLLRHTSNMI